MWEAHCCRRVYREVSRAKAHTARLSCIIGKTKCDFFEKNNKKITYFFVDSKYNYIFVVLNN